jgi:hypothetical protein
MKKSKSIPTLPNTPATITAEQLAGLSNLTKRRLYQLADEHKIPQPVNGCFPMLETITFLFSYYQRDGQDLQRERLLKIAAERKLREHELALTDGTLIDRAEAERTMSAAMKKYHGLVRSRLERRDIKTIADFHAALGLSDSDKSALHGFHLDLARKTVDGIEDDCAAIGRGEEPAQEATAPQSHAPTPAAVTPAVK